MRNFFVHERRKGWMRGSLGETEHFIRSLAEFIGFVLERERGAASGGERKRKFITFPSHHPISSESIQIINR